MNSSTTPNASGAAGLPRAVWIGGGLMALTIIALATTLVVKGNGNDTTADNTVAPLVATTTTAGAPTTEQSSVAKSDAKTPANESTKPVHHTTTPAHHDTARDNAPAAQQQQVAAAAPVCATCGVVEGYTAVQVQGKNNGVGAVAGGLGGALIGSKIAGRGNHTLGGAIGAVGGGLLGNAIESHERTSTAYDVRVRMDDGSVRTVRQAAVPTVGQHVNVEGNALKAVAAQG
ncbi:MAG: glycine zipper 2TM domain-containing protein [Burkholderiales bacterium]|nr:glycine zipper 2TM domain-containing protein [Burkholderiales bacterium]